MDGHNLGPPLLSKPLIFNRFNVVDGVRINSGYEAEALNGTLDSSDSFGGGNGFGSGCSDCVELGFAAVGISADAAGSASGAGGSAGVGGRDSGRRKKVGFTTDAAG